MIALLIDIGNSRVKWRQVRLGADATDAFPDWDSTGQAIGLSDVGRIDAALRASAGNAPLSKPIDMAVIANVASDAVGATVAAAVLATWPGTAVRWVRSGTGSSGGLVNGYRDPRQLGVDRWLAAVAAHALCPDRTVLVCTFGTATTIDLVEHDRFVGGLILPGIEAMCNALTQSTARLGVRAGRVVAFADRTEDAITSGVMSSQIGAVERALRNIRKRRRPGDDLEALCVVAGGGADRMATLFDELDTPHRVIHDLVLRGLAHAARDVEATNSPMWTSR